METGDKVFGISKAHFKSRKEHSLYVASSMFMSDCKNVL